MFGLQGAIVQSEKSKTLGSWQNEECGKDFAHYAQALVNICNLHSCSC